MLRFPTFSPCRFFLYHIHLWVTFLDLSGPFVSEALEAATSAVSCLGLCLQLSLTLDVFNVVTLHVHAFYAYARRLFIVEWSGLAGFWRMFRGKRYNPLRKRVESWNYRTEQLYVGALLFTIMVFLFPTVAAYAAVFWLLEMAVAGTNLVVWKAVGVASMTN